MPDRFGDLSDELFSAAADGELSDDERDYLEAVLDSDPAARRKVESFGRVKRLVRSALVTTAPEPDYRRILTSALDRVDAERRATRRPLPALGGARLWRLAPALAAGIAVCGLGILSLPTPNSRLAGGGLALLSPAEGEWQVQPASLAARHASWHDQFRMWPQRAAQLVNITPRLQAEVGYPVLEPDLEALDAVVYAATADIGAAGPRRMTAMLFLRRADGGEFSLTQVTAPPASVHAVGFVPTTSSPVQLAGYDGINVAYYPRDWVHVWLASTSIQPQVLAALAPRSLRWDDLPEGSPKFGVIEPRPTTVTVGNP